MDRSPSDQSPTPTNTFLQSPGYRQRQNRILSLQKTLLGYGSDIMARVTRSSKHKATPTSTPTRPAKVDADTPIDSIENATRDKDNKGPYKRKARKKRQRDIRYKIKKKSQASGAKREALPNLSLTRAERETLRAGIQGSKTAQKLADVVLEHRAEIDRLRKQLHADTKNSPEESAVTPASSNDSARARAGSRQQPPKAVV